MAIGRPGFRDGHPSQAGGRRPFRYFGVTNGPGRFDFLRRFLRGRAHGCRTVSPLCYDARRGRLFLGRCFDRFRGVLVAEAGDGRRAAISLFVRFDYGGSLHCAGSFRCVDSFRSGASSDFGDLFHRCYFVDFFPVVYRAYEGVSLLLTRAQEWGRLKCQDAVRPWLRGKWPLEDLLLALP